MVINSTNINKTNNHLSPQLNTTKKITTLEILVLVWDSAISETDPDLPLCLDVFKHGVPLTKWGGGGHLPANIFYDGCLLMWCNFKFEGVLFRSESSHNGRVDSLPPSGPK